MIPLVVLIDDDDDDIVNGHDDDDEDSAVVMMIIIIITPLVGRPVPPPSWPRGSCSAEDTGPADATDDIANVHDDDEDSAVVIIVMMMMLMMMTMMTTAVMLVMIFDDGDDATGGNGDDGVDYDIWCDGVSDDSEGGGGVGVTDDCGHGPPDDHGDDATADDYGHS